MIAHWTQHMPDRIPRGEAHWSKRMPERLPHGERNGAYTHPERFPRGTAHGMAKLNDDAVCAIRSAAARGATERRLADLYNVKQPLIGYIVRREIWTHVV